MPHIHPRLYACATPHIVVDVILKRPNRVAILVSSFPSFFFPPKKARRLRGELNRRCRAATAPQWINFYTPTSRDRIGVQSWHHHSLYLINKGREYQVWERFNYRRQIKTVCENPAQKTTKAQKWLKLRGWAIFISCCLIFGASRDSKMMRRQQLTLPTLVLLVLINKTLGYEIDLSTANGYAWSAALPNKSNYCRLIFTSCRLINVFFFIFRHRGSRESSG